jgi:hypothetical protein
MGLVLVLQLCAKGEGVVEGKLLLLWVQGRVEAAHHVNPTPGAVFSGSTIECLGLLVALNT